MSAKSRRILAKLRDRDTRRRLLEALNASTAPEGAPVSGGGQEMKVLKEMNEIQEFENENWSKGGRLNQGTPASRWRRWWKGSKRPDFMK